MGGGSGQEGEISVCRLVNGREKNGQKEGDEDYEPAD
jgi:hypothetical protein